MAYSSELYQQVILDHNRNPRNFRTMENATYACHGRNPLCGDELTVYLKVDAEGKVSDLSFQGQGCAISKASASLMTTAVKGKSVEEAKTMFREFHDMVLGEMDPATTAHHLGKLTLFQGVREYPSRVKCASLAWHAMAGALEHKEETSTEA